MRIVLRNHLQHARGCSGGPRDYAPCSIKTAAPSLWSLLPRKVENKDFYLPLAFLNPASLFLRRKPTLESVFTQQLALHLDGAVTGEGWLTTHLHIRHNWWSLVPRARKRLMAGWALETGEWPPWIPRQLFSHGLLFSLIFFSPGLGLANAAPSASPHAPVCSVLTMTLCVDWKRSLLHWPVKDRWKSQRS